MLRCVAVGIVMSVVGCEHPVATPRTDDAGTAADGFGGPADAKAEVASTHHYDCFGGVECHDGVVTSYLRTPVSSDQWTGSCPIDATYQCVQGCAIERPNLGSLATPSQLPAFCAETPSKHQNDPCDSELDCRPNRAESQPDGSLVTTFLACDSSTWTCAPTAGPPLGDLGTPCDGSGRVRDVNGQAFDAVACAGSTCLRFADPVAGCVRTGCTRSCGGDEDCPSGWFCDKALDDLSAAGGVGLPVCRPGPRDGVPTLLPCR